jgi:hypothetical protein
MANLTIEQISTGWVGENQLLSGISSKPGLTNDLAWGNWISTLFFRSSSMATK